MKRKDETRILTEEAFWKVLATGSAPTVDRINNWLTENGYGSRDRAVINGALKPCWVKLGERARGSFAVPGVSDEAVALFQRLCEDLLAEARRELEVDRNEIRLRADTEVRAAQQTAREAAQDAENARSEQRQSAAAFEALSADRERMRLESEREVARLQDQLGQARQEVAGLRAQLEAEVAARAAERDGAAREQTRQALEIDGLRTENKASIVRADRLQSDLEAALLREREMADRARDMSAEMGTLRGSERALQQQLSDLRTSIGQREDEVALLRGQVEGVREQLRARDAELARLQAALAASLPLDISQLLELVAQAWATGASAPGKRVPPSEDEQAVYGERGDRYARRALKAVGIKAPPTR